MNASASDKAISEIDSRSLATQKIEVTDHGVVLEYGDGPDGCDLYGAREPSLFRANDKCYLFYDGAGHDAWRACLAVSDDLVHWTKLGAKLELGSEGEPDSAAASSPWVFEENGMWVMYYLASPNASEPPERCPQFPYLTLRATADHPEGPWIKDKSFKPFATVPGTWVGTTASPGYIVKDGDEYLQFISGSIMVHPNKAPWAKRTLGLAVTKDLMGDWNVADEPLLPLDEQIENTSLFFEEESKTWFMFTNRITIEDHPHLGRIEYADSVWVYWSKDLRQWSPDNKALVIDGKSCSWANYCIGMPTVARVGDRLAVLYDGTPGDSLHNNYRHIGLCWIDLPVLQTLIRI